MADDFALLHLQAMLCGGAPAALAMHGIQKDGTRAGNGEGIAMETGMFPGRKFGRNALQVHFIVAGRSLLVSVGKDQRFNLCKAGGYQKVSQVRATGSGKVRMTETQDGIVVVMIAAGKARVRIRA